MQPSTCPIEMSDVLSCGRPIHAALAGCDETPVCLMHSRDPNKSQDEFSREIKAIMAGSSSYNRPNDLFDFCGFFFLVADFRKETFAKNVDFGSAIFSRHADFGGATFIEEADFISATFTKNSNFRKATFAKNVDLGFTTFTKRAIFDQACFDRNAEFQDATFIEEAIFNYATFSGVANFSQATFTKGGNFYTSTFTKEANFREAAFTKATSFVQTTFIEATNFFRATFTEVANFLEVTFTQNADFSGATFCEAAFFDDVAFGPRTDPLITTVASSAIADFRGVRFLKPEQVRFLRTNGKATAGLRVRFVSCHIVGVQFDAVQWYRQNGRMVLQDELDVIEQGEEASSYEEVGIAYRRLIINFEKARAYDLAEDCTIGEFEMKRRDPSRFIFAKRLESLYDRFPRFRRWVGEWLSVVGIYRLVSIYGTSYQRAGVVLVLLFLGFALVFATIIGIHPLPLNPGATSTCGQSNRLEALCAGVVHALEVATLQREVLYKPDSPRGRVVEIFEQVFIAGQAALLLFALRRRFRR